MSISFLPPDVPVICIALANERTAQGYLSSLSRELDAIIRALQPAVRNRMVELCILPAATASQIADIFQDRWYERRIKVFHYAGHADTEELWLENASGGNQSFSSLGLARFLGAQRSLQVVFLNGCATQQHADLLMQTGIPNTIVTAVKINDEQAYNFAERFYKGISTGANLSEAFQEAEAFVLGNTQNVQDNITRGLFWKKAVESETMQFPWRIFTHPPADPEAQQQPWRLFKGFIDAGENMSEAEAIAQSFIGVELNNYRIVKLLGMSPGGMTFKAVHNSFHDEVAIKISHRITAGFSSAQSLLFGGFRAMRHLRHANIAPVLDVGAIQDDRLFVIRELLRGDRLDEILASGIASGETGNEQALAFLLQIAEGLSAAHSMQYANDDGTKIEGMVHGNLRARKVMMTLSMAPKINDFLFSDVDQAPGVQVKLPDGITNTVDDEAPGDYMAPECISGRVKPNKLSDVYSLGALIFKVLMVEGIHRYLPLSEASIRSMLAARHSGIPAGVAGVLAKALESDPAKRYPDAQALLKELRIAVNWGAANISVADLDQASAWDSEEMMVEMMKDKVISSYKLTQFLDVGERGYVFRAEHVETGEAAAIKITHRLVKGAEKAERLIRQSASLLQSLDHPNIVKIKEMGAIGVNEYLYVVMEFVPGKSLNREKPQVQGMSRMQLFGLFRHATHLCEGLYAAHRYEYLDKSGQTIFGVLHGNLKPSKIIFTPDGNTKIIDFLFSEILNDPEIVMAIPRQIRQQIREDRSARFLPAEVLTGSQSISKRSDVFSLGSIFYELISGNRLDEYYPESEEKIARFFEQVNPRIPRKASKYVYKAIHPDPYKRYNTAGEFLQDLLKLLPWVMATGYRLRYGRF